MQVTNVPTTTQGHDHFSQNTQAFEGKIWSLLEKDDYESGLNSISTEIQTIESKINSIDTTSSQSDEDLENAINEAITEKSLMISNMNVLTKILDHLQSAKNPQNNHTIKTITTMLTTATQSETNVNNKISALVSERNRREAEKQLNKNKEKHDEEKKKMDKDTEDKQIEAKIQEAQQEEIKRLARLKNNL